MDKSVAKKQTFFSSKQAIARLLKKKTKIVTKAVLLLT